jgi:hypothetical protein
LRGVACTEVRFSKTSIHYRSIMRPREDANRSAGGLV